MSCLLTLAASICLVQPSEFTLRADISTQVAGDVTHWSGSHNYGGARLGHVGLELPLLTYRGFAVTAGYIHESLLDTQHDRGEERLTLGLVFRPFGGAR